VFEFINDVSPYQSSTGSFGISIKLKSNNVFIWLAYGFFYFLQIKGSYNDIGIFLTACCYVSIQVCKLNVTNIASILEVSVFCMLF